MTGSGLDRAARDLRAARQRLDTAMESAKTTALAAIAGGATEVDVARALGVNRLTVRRWQGKR